MQCIEFESRLHDVLDHREDPGLDNELAVHAQACEKCGQYLASQQALFLSLSGSSIGKVPVSSAQPATSLPGFWLVVNPAITLAAILLMGLLVTVAFQDPSHQPGHQPGQAAVKVALPAKTVPSHELVATQPNWALPQSLPNVQQWWNEATAQSGGIPISEPVSCGLRPVANSVSSAWNVLRSSLPRVRATPTTPTASQTFCDSLPQITA